MDELMRPCTPRPGIWTQKRGEAAEKGKTDQRLPGALAG